MRVYIDVTNIMEVSFLTGIQRVVREVLVRLIKDASLQCVLIKYHGEREDYLKVDTDKFYDYFKHDIGTREACLTDEICDIDRIAAGSIFFEIDGVWGLHIPRSVLYARLKARGVRIITYIYDTIPITHPSLCDKNTTFKFMDYFYACMKYDDEIICSTKSVIDSIHSIEDELGLRRTKAHVSWLGSDFMRGGASLESVVREDVGKFFEKHKKYILIVGTVEPRKNHKLLLDAFDSKLYEKGYALVIVGKIGWNISDIEDRIRNSEHLDEDLYLFEGLDDYNVDLLYKAATFVAFPTYDEGFGLPVIEAFDRGTPVITSDIPVMREVAGELGVYFECGSSEAFAEALLTCVEDEARYAALREKVAAYKPYTWDEVTQNIKSVLCARETTDVKETKSIKQIVYLSNRCTDLLDTLEHVEHYMTFLEKLVVCCPESMREEFISRYHGRLEVTILTDEMILDGRSMPNDHQKRNSFMRGLAVSRDEIDEVFIMADDDGRPLTYIGEDVYVKDGRYQAYFFYDMKNYKGSIGEYSSYDMGVFKTLEFVEKHFYPTLQYSSHMPQVIDRERYREFLAVHPGVESLGIDEWSGYFNWLVYTYPDIVDSRPYLTLSWPCAPTDWKMALLQGDFLFENYYEHMYEEGGLYHGISQKLCKTTDEDNKQKIALYAKRRDRYLEYQSSYDEYEKNYARRYGEYPRFVISYREKLELYLPSHIELPAGGFVRVRFVLDGMKDRDIKLGGCFCQGSKDAAMNSHQLSAHIDWEDEAELPVFVPEQISAKDVYLLVTIQCGQEMISKKIPVRACKKK